MISLRFLVFSFCVLLKIQMIFSFSQIKNNNSKEKIFKSEKIELDRKTLQPLKKVESEKLDSIKDRILEITTFFEGNFDPSDKIQLTTRIRDYKNNEITYISPSFKEINGKLTYTNSVLQEKNKESYILKGKTESNVKGNGNLQIHIQQFQSDKEKDNRVLFEQYSSFLKTYIEYLEKYNIDIKRRDFENLENSFVYFGSLSKGKNPSIQNSFSNQLKKNKNSKESVYETSSQTDGKYDSSFSYGVSNQKNINEAQNFQNLISSADGENPLTVLQLKILKEDLFIRGNIIGESFAEINDKESQTLIDSISNNSEFGFSNNIISSKEQEDILTTSTEINNLSVADKKLNNNHIILLNPPSNSHKENFPTILQKNQLLINGKFIN